MFITVKEYLWKKNIDVGNDEIFSQQERKNILDKVKNFYENQITEKNKLIQNMVNNIEQIKQICGDDFKKGSNKMAHETLKMVYEELKEVQNENS